MMGWIFMIYDGLGYDGCACVPGSGCQTGGAGQRCLEALTDPAHT
jgi:hypothetical protein